MSEQAYRGGRPARWLAAAGRHPWRVTTAIWFALAIWLVWHRWAPIGAFALSDTDDNLRLVQVRDLLTGQGWFDLRQQRLDPPRGFDIHWSRLVDLPIAGLILLLKPFLGGAGAERWAAALAPLLPLAATAGALSVAVRRLVADGAFWLGPALLIPAGYVLGMMQPLRVDHHGWQLSALAWLVAGLGDRQAVRGGVTAAAATVVSLVIGLEMLPYLAIGAGMIGLWWVWLGEERGPALRAYAAVLASGSAVGFALFASAANRAPMCDVLSPVWLTATIGGGALLWAVSLVPAGSRVARLGLAAGAAVLLAAAFALLWPDCLGRPERVSPELDRLWLSNVREARPIFAQTTQVALPMVALPLIGIVGTVWAAWRARGSAAAGRWLAVLLPALTATGLLAWQTRAAPAAQLLGIPGAAALAWGVLRWALGRGTLIQRALVLFAGFMILSGFGLTAVLRWFPPDPPTERTRTINRANARCPTLSALRPIARMEPATVFTFVDYGPRLLAVTRHRAIAGPYHRNGAAILDVHHAFGGAPEEARRIVLRHGATLVLICPDASESTLYRARNRNGFYARLARGERFDWLEPVALPPGSPWRLWRVRGGEAVPASGSSGS